MRFLIDENLSPRLVAALNDLFPGSTHVESLQLRVCDDARVWAVARDGGYLILTKDDDFNARSILCGSPPKVVRLRVGNVATETVVALLRDRQRVVEAFAMDQVTSGRPAAPARDTATVDRSPRGRSTGRASAVGPRWGQRALPTRPPSSLPQR